MTDQNIDFSDQVADVRLALAQIMRVSEGITLAGTHELGSRAVMIAMASSVEQTASKALSSLKELIEWHGMEAVRTNPAAVLASELFHRSMSAARADAFARAVERLKARAEDTRTGAVQ